MKIRWDSENESPLTVGLPIGVGIVPKDVFRPDGRGQAPHLRLVCLIFLIDNAIHSATSTTGERFLNTHTANGDKFVCVKSVLSKCVEVDVNIRGCQVSVRTHIYIRSVRTCLWTYQVDRDSRRGRAEVDGCASCVWSWMVKVACVHGQ